MVLFNGCPLNACACLPLCAAGRRANRFLIAGKMLFMKGNHVVDFGINSYLFSINFDLFTLNVWKCFEQMSQKQCNFNNLVQPHTIICLKDSGQCISLQ